jgi:hypothetical protein
LKCIWTATSCKLHGDLYGLIFWCDGLHLHGPMISPAIVLVSICCLIILRGALICPGLSCFRYLSNITIGDVNYYVVFCTISFLCNVGFVVFVLYNRKKRVSSNRLSEEIDEMKHFLCSTKRYRFLLKAGCNLTAAALNIFWS